MVFNAESINLARRNSVQNENDLMQEDYGSPPTTPTTSPKACLAMIEQVCPDSPLPAECARYAEVKMALQRHNSDKHAHAVAFEGMSPGQAAAAMTARQRGQLNNAQIQRRMTSSGSKHRWWA